MADGELGRARAAAREFNRQIQEYIALVVEDYLRRIDASLLSGRIAAGALPPGTVIDRGTYNPAARYRPGDIVVADDGVNYIATAASTGIAPPDTTVWRPIGGVSGTEYLFFDGAGLVFDDEALSWG